MTQELPIWKQILRNNFFNWPKLAQFLDLSPQQRLAVQENPRFVLNLPFRLASKIQKGTLDDPILKQFLPMRCEETPKLGFVNDPVNDSSCKRSNKLLQKYEGRALLVCTSACAMHCRYCFRQNFDYDVARKLFDDELKILEADNSIHEIILSGGDPLSLSDDILWSLFEALNKIKHIRRLRIHTRFPIGIPERIDQGLLNILQKVTKQIYFVIHANHPLELDSDVLNSLANLRRLGAIVMNQAVLLRGVNDDVDTLTNLCEILVDNGVLPYYVHQLDKVEGASHFEVSIEEGKFLMDALAAKLPGYAVPRYVREVFGEPSKTPII